MCLYFDDHQKCSHPECFYINSLKTNFSFDFDKNIDKLSEIELKQNEPEGFRESKIKLNENDKNSTPLGRYEQKKNKKHLVSVDQQEMTEEKHQAVKMDQFIDSQLKILLDQNVADFITQLSSKFTQSLRHQNTINQQRLQNLQKRLQELQNRKG